MDVMNAITQLITNVGFPIACCVVLFYQNNKQRESMDELKTTIEKNSSCVVLFYQNNKQRESMDELKTTIEKNSTILDKVFDKLDRMDGDGK